MIKAINNQKVIVSIIFAFRILGIAFLIGFFLPLGAAKLSGVVYESDVTKKILSDTTFRINKSLQQYKDSTARLGRILNKVDSSLLSINFNNPNSDRLSYTLQYREYIEQQINAHKQAIRSGGFYLGSTMLLWPLTLTFLGWLLFLFRPVREQIQIKFKYVTSLFTGIWLTYRVPVWMRNIIFSDGERKYYGHANIDIDFPGFLVQEFQAICIVVLLVMIWINWIEFYVQKNYQFEVNQVKDPFIEIFAGDRTNQLAKVFLHWQVSSLILVGAFIGWSYYYWDIVFVVKDRRYMMSAVIVHMIWLATWIIISLPLLSVWYNWQKLKLHAISAFLHDVDKNTAYTGTEDFLKAINEIHPIGFWNVAASGIGIIISLITPILQAFYNS